MNKALYGLCLFVVALHLAPLLRLVNVLPFGRTAVVVVGVTIIPFVLTTSYLARKDITLTKLDWSVLSYIFISLLSVAAYLQQDAPTDLLAFVYGVHYGVLPIMCFFAIKTLSPAHRFKVLQMVLAMNSFAIVLGIYLYYARPAWYSAALEEILFVTRTEMTEDWRKFARLQSYLGSTAVGTICAASILAVTLLQRAQLWLLFTLPIMVAGVILSKQRGGIMAAAFALAVLIISDRRRMLSRLLVLGFASIALYFILEEFEDTHTGTISSIVTRAQDLETVWEYRGYGPGIDYLTHWPLGVGLGGTLSASDSAGLASRGQVVDANFMRIAADLGLQGILIFAVMIGLAIKSAARTRKLAAVGLIMVFLIVCLGTNTLDSHLVSHCFWLFLGFIDAQSREMTEVPRFADASSAGDSLKAEPSPSLRVGSET